MTNLHGRALSNNEIELSWDEPSPANGDLKPYEVWCLDIKGQPTIPISTVNQKSTISNLKRNSEYRCILKASTYPEVKQDPKACEVFIHSHPIKTLDSGGFQTGTNRF